MSIKVKIGTEFREAITDCNALWRVTSKVARGVWEVTVVNEPWECGGETYDSDYAGTRRVYRTSDIVRILTWEASVARMMKAHEDYYAALELGSTIHYHNGFGQFVRCDVVVGVDKDGVEGRMLRSIALVGAWSDLDLRVDSYHVRQIAEGSLMKPNAGNLYENPDANCSRAHADPCMATPLPLPMNKAERAEAMARG